MRVEITTDERGRPLAVKRAEDGDDRARLRREADLLEAATHPGLVELVELVEGQQASLSTVHLEGGSLADERALEVEEIAGAAAAVASTLADLHELGLVHGAVAPEHVLLDGEGRPVLCSLGYGGLAGQHRPVPPGVAAEFADPAPSDARLDPSADVYALGALVVTLLATAKGGPRGGSADALRRIAERARSVIAAERPAARELADDIHDQIPGARLPGLSGAARSAVGPPPPDRRQPLETWRAAQLPAPAPSRRRPHPVAVVAAVLAAGAVAGVLALRGDPEAQEVVPRERARPPEPSVAPTTVATVGPTSTTVATASVATSTPRSGCPEVTGPLAADVDGDGCAEPVQFSDGIVEAGGRRWRVGDAGDVIAVGDWSCSGVRSLAVLRPGTGEVFTFSGWASGGEPLEGPLLARVAGGRALRTADLDADGCNELVVERSEGAPTVLRAARTGR